jgi:hypothetical protein
MKTLARFTIGVAVIGIAALSGGWAASDTPDLSGTWKLNVMKSDFSRVGGLNEKSLRINHQEPKLRVAVVFSDFFGEHSESYNFTTDGKKSSNSMSGYSSEMTSIWSGGQLIVDVARAQDIAYKERWSLSSDRKTLTIKRHTILPRGEIKEEFVFDKQ